MAKVRHDLERRRREVADTWRPKGKRYHCLLGDFSGNVRPADRPSDFYVRVPQAGSSTYSLAILSGNVRAIYNLPVVVEEDPLTHEQYIVGGDALFIKYGEDSGNTPAPPAGLVNHGQTHGWGGDDQIDWLNTLQVFPLRVQPSSTARHVVVQAGMAPLDGGWVAVTSAIDVDLSSYWPSTGGVYVLLYLSSATTVVVDVCGLTPASVSNPPPGKCALAAVRLMASATAVTWPDIIDMRFLDNLAYVEELGTEENDTTRVLKPDGAGAVEWVPNDTLASPDGAVFDVVQTVNGGGVIIQGSITVADEELIDGVDLSDHDHSGGVGMGVQIDALHLVTTEMTTTKVLMPDGAGGVVWGTGGGGGAVEDLTTVQMIDTVILRPDGAGGVVWSSTMELGAAASLVDFPRAQAVVSQGNSGHTYDQNIGFVGEAAADGTYQAVGIGGVASTYGSKNARGSVGRGVVSATGDTADSIGLQGIANATHAGGANIAVSAIAANGATDYAFYGVSGILYNSGVIVGAGDGRLGGGLYVGGTGADPATGDIMATGDGRFGGGLSIGSTEVDPGAGEIWATGDGHFSGSIMTFGGGFFAYGIVAGRAGGGMNEGVMAFYNGDDYMGDISWMVDTTWFRINNTSAKNIYTPRMLRADGGLSAGSVTADSGCVYATSDGRFGGGIYVGDTGTDPATGDVVATADGRFGGGMCVGSYSNNPATGEIAFYNGSTRMGEIAGTVDTTWLRINNTTAKNIYTPRMLRADGGLSTGNVAAASGCVYATVDGCFGGGLYVGSTGTNPATGTITATAEIVSNTTVKGTTGFLVPYTPQGVSRYALDAAWGSGYDVANNTAVAMTADNGFAGLILVIDNNYGALGMFLQGGGTVVLVSQSQTRYSVAAGTSSKINVYQSGGRMYIENKTGSTDNFRVFMLRMRGWF